MSHGYHVAKAPPGFTVTARTERVPVSAFANDERRWYGVQFHPEVTHTQSGQAMLRPFMVDICGCETLWTASPIIAYPVGRAREQGGSDHVIAALSAGLDSPHVSDPL